MRAIEQGLVLLSCALLGCDGSGLSTSPVGATGVFTGAGTSQATTGATTATTLSGSTGAASTTSAAASGVSTTGGASSGFIAGGTSDGTTTSSSTTGSSASCVGVGQGAPPTYTRLLAGVGGEADNGIYELLPPRGNELLVPTSLYPNAVAAGPAGQVWFYVADDDVYALLPDGGIVSQMLPQDVLDNGPLEGGGLAAVAVGSTTLEAFNIGLIGGAAGIEGYGAPTQTSSDALWATYSDLLAAEYIHFTAAQLLAVSGGLAAAGGGIGYALISGVDGSLCGATGPLVPSSSGSFLGVAQGPDSAIYLTGSDGNQHGLIAAVSVSGSCLWERTGGQCGVLDEIAACAASQCAVDPNLTDFVLGQAAFVSGSLYFMADAVSTGIWQIDQLDPITQAVTPFRTDRDYLALGAAP